MEWFQYLEAEGYLEKLSPAAVQRLAEVKQQQARFNQLAEILAQAQDQLPAGSDARLVLDLLGRSVLDLRRLAEAENQAMALILADALRNR